MAWVNGEWVPDTVDEFNATYGEGNLSTTGLNFSDDWASPDASWMTDQSNYINDPGFYEWLNSNDWANDVGFTEFLNQPLPGYDAQGNWIGGANSGGLDFSGIANQPSGTSTDWSGMLSGALGSLGSFLNNQQTTAALGTGASLLGGYLNTQAARDAAQTQANAQIQAARIAAEAAKFKPVGVTTRFGESQFGYDANGNLTSAGYNVSPELKAQQDRLMAASGNMLGQFEGAQQATAPMAAGAQSMFGLGQQYLGTSPQEQAQKYYADQMALLAPQRAQDMAALQAQMQAQGRAGFAMGGDAGMAAANPQLQALMNAQRQQDLGLAAQATQGGMDYAKFGAGMLGLGGQTLQDMYRTQQAAYSPYQTALGGAQTIEGLGQNALDVGTRLGSVVTAANAQGGQLLGRGMTNAANTVGNTAQQAGSTWGNLLQGAAPALQQYRWGT